MRTWFKTLWYLLRGYGVMYRMQVIILDDGSLTFPSDHKAIVANCHFDFSN